MSELYPVCRILSSGVGLTIQDYGRPGWRRYGLPASGAMDSYSMAWANRLLGNSRNMPVLEMAFQGVKLEFLRDAWIACCGADLDSDLKPWTARKIDKGEILSFGRNVSGVFAYLALLGGWGSEKWFGSCSVNVRAEIGEALKADGILYSQSRIGSNEFDGIRRRIVSSNEQRDYSSSRCLRVFPGPQSSDFSEKQIAFFISNTWRISSRSDRTGYRLDGGKLRTDKVISSEPTLPGSVQVTPSGQPIVTLNDGPTVGGYPKIGLIHPDDLSWFVQCGPNKEVSFEWVD